MNNSYFNLYFFFKYIIFVIVCNNISAKNKIITGAENTDKYIHLLKNKNIGICTNSSSMIENIHLVDFILKSNYNIIKIFSPEHGFRTNSDAGEITNDYIDPKTNIPVISLYGNKKKPSKKDMENINLLVFDLQDVGVRFYTYISTLHYIMETCAESNIKLIILDRPNPNIHYIDGPLLEKRFSSFVGMHPVPIVYGMTIGEYALMINGEKWINNECNLTIVPCLNYTRESKYTIPYNPSPNLRNNNAINLYPSLCLFEGTNISVGRGTDFPFEVFGSPFLSNCNFSFIPKSSFGAKKPLYMNEKCFGFDLRKKNNISEINLNWIFFAFSNSKNKHDFFNSFFNKLAGNSSLQEDIKNNISITEIKKKWKKDIENFKKIREKYLIYK